VNPANSAFKTLLEGMAASANDKDAAIADNYLFEERVGVVRQQEYENGLSSPANIKDWRAHHNSTYVTNRIKGGGNDFIPDTFLEINRSVLLANIAPNEELIRVEDLRYPLSKSTAKLTHKQLADLLNRRNEPDAVGILNTFVEEWNRVRANWPMFGALYQDVQDDAEHDDWPHQLRDRLGLDHYQGSNSERIPVALMRYQSRLALDKVKKDRRFAAGFALPTTLDGELNPAYFPAPAGHPFGAALNLSEPWQPLLSAEVLNLRIDYQPAHLWKVGEIVRPTGYRNLRAQRDKHLTLLRTETDNASFGQFMVGRT